MDLPIIAKKAEIIEAVTNNKVVLVTGETGCGKTSQLPVILHEMGLSQRGPIVVAEPRRAAAIATAEYVASQIGSELGERVGYHVRFGNVSVAGTSIKFVTNGILLREMFSGSLFERYGAVIIDEAHERSLEIDLLLGLAKRAARIRDSFRVVIASATLNAEALSKYFEGAPVINIPGRQFPVNILYHRRTLPRIEWVVRGVAKKIMAILADTKEGDILAFMPGRDSIEAVIAEIWSRGGGRIVTLPFHKDMETTEYHRIFEEFPGMRKVIIATNIAETSLTLPTVKFVLDSGLIKEVDYCSETEIESLAIVPHSQSGCIQRSGRVGRVSEGTCYRLYPEPSFEFRPPYTKPEILRRKLDTTLLYLRILGFEDPGAFEFVDKPDERVFTQAKDELVKLGAISSTNGDLTNAGKLMMALPLVPRVGRLVVEAVKRGCVREILSYASFLASPAVFLRPWGNEKKARLVQSQFFVPHSDVLTFLKVWQGYADSGHSKAWCEEHFLCPHALGEVALAREQLSRILLDRNIGMSSNSSEDVLVQTIASSLHAYLLKHEGKGNYVGVFHDFGKVRIHPESALWGTTPDHIVATSIIKIRHPYAAQCTAVNREIMAKVFPQLLPKPAQEVPKEKAVERQPVPEVTPTPVEASEKSVVDEKVTLVFVKRKNELVALYRGALLQKLERGSIVPIPGRLYSCSVFSEEGKLTLKLHKEILPGEKNGKNDTHRIIGDVVKSKIDRRLEVTEETADLAHDLASSWQCRLDD